MYLYIILNNLRCVSERCIATCMYIFLFYNFITLYHNIFFYKLANWCFTPLNRTSDFPKTDCWINGSLRERASQSLPNQTLTFQSDVEELTTCYIIVILPLGESKPSFISVKLARLSSCYRIRGLRFMLQSNLHDQRWWSLSIFPKIVQNIVQVHFFCSNMI